MKLQIRIKGCVYYSPLLIQPCNLVFDLPFLVSQGPYDVVLLPGGMPGAQNLAEVRKYENNRWVERDASFHNYTERFLMVATSFCF